MTVNVVLTAIDVIGLVIIVVIGVAALGEGSGDFSRNFEFTVRSSAAPPWRSTR